jgi:hypothetical protein
MANYPLKGRSGSYPILQWIRRGVGDQMEKHLMYNVPAFPLDQDRLEELANPEPIIKAVRTLRSLKFGKFNTVERVHVAFNGSLIPRGLTARFSVSAFIVTDPANTCAHDNNWRAAVAAACKLDGARMDQDERQAVVDWVATAVKYRRQYRLVFTTLEAVYDKLETSYQLLATWPTLAGMIDWDQMKIARGSRNDDYHWRGKLQEKPRNPEAYNVAIHIPTDQDIYKRIEACDVLLLKATMLPDKPRTGLGFELQSWEPKDGDPAWLTPG